jgi:nitrate reductase NapE component
MSQDSSWFPTRRWFRALLMGFCMLPSLAIGFAGNWRVGVAWMVMAIAGFVMVERRWYCKKQR